jgi:hypothetical protein
VRFLRICERRDGPGIVRAIDTLIYDHVVTSRRVPTMSQESAPRSMAAFTWTSQSMSRPNTSAHARQSRPVTARPQTAASAKLDDHCIIALFEGRGVSHEVGLAALNRDTGQLVLVQVGALTLAYMIVYPCTPSSRIAKLMSRRCIKCICTRQR